MRQQRETRAGDIKISRGLYFLGARGVKQVLASIVDNPGHKLVSNCPNRQTKPHRTTSTVYDGLYVINRSNRN
jgi:hypothetical protein